MSNRLKLVKINELEYVNPLHVVSIEIKPLNIKDMYQICVKLSNGKSIQSAHKLENTLKLLID